MLTRLFMVAAMTMAPGAALFEAVKASKTPIDPETGREVQCDLPPSQHMRNIRGKNGQGCCVYASSEMMSRYMNFPLLTGVLAEGLGGASASDVERMYKRKAPGFSDYVQATGKHSVPHMDWAMRTRRLCCVTVDGNHMVCLLHLDPEGTPNARACLLDNNSPQTWLWMPRAEFLKRHAVGGPWSHSILLSPPPPIPVVSKGA